jgi:hypothetical protein
MRVDHKQSVKEVVRHVLFTTGLIDMLNVNRQRRGLKVAHLSHPTIADRFTAVYELGVWRHSSGQESSSGVGSTKLATAGVAVELPVVLESIKATRLLDVGCGDWSWMRDVKIPCQYVGIDVVPSVIDALRSFERPGVSFAVCDAIQGPLPRADVALCREVLFHLSFKDGAAVLDNIRKSAKWLIATSDTSLWFNSDIASGDYRKINLQRRPYRLPPPVRMIQDDAISAGRILGLWRTSELPVVAQAPKANSVTSSRS